MTIRKKIMLGLLSFVFIIGSYFASQFIYRLDKTLVTISAEPVTSKISINGTVINSSSIYLKPGKYIISVSQDGYYEYRKTYKIEKKTIIIPIKLVAEPEESIYNLIHGTKYNTVVAKYPIITKLPYSSLLIDINHSSDSTLSSFKLSVRAYDGYKQAVITKIKQWGYNPADYNIEFINYENPFKLWKKYILLSFQLSP